MEENMDMEKETMDNEGAVDEGMNDAPVEEGTDTDAADEGMGGDDEASAEGEAAVE